MNKRQEVVISSSAPFPEPLTKQKNKNGLHIRQLLVDLERSSCINVF